ncbi:hypothetical protein [Pseudoalteromonas piscicida]
MSKTNLKKFKQLKLADLKKVSGGDCYYVDKRYSKGAEFNGKTCQGGEWM